MAMDMIVLRWRRSYGKSTVGSEASVSVFLGGRGVLGCAQPASSRQPPSAIGAPMLRFLRGIVSRRTDARGSAGAGDVRTRLASTFERFPLAVRLAALLASVGFGAGDAVMRVTVTGHDGSLAGAPLCSLRFSRLPFLAKTVPLASSAGLADASFALPRSACSRGPMQMRRACASRPRASFCPCAAWTRACRRSWRSGSAAGVARRPSPTFLPPRARL